jgi:hypothetical protein
MCKLLGQNVTFRSLAQSQFKRPSLKQEVNKVPSLRGTKQSLSYTERLCKLGVAS